MAIEQVSLMIITKQHLQQKQQHTNLINEILQPTATNPPFATLNCACAATWQSRTKTDLTGLGIKQHCRQQVRSSQIHCRVARCFTSHDHPSRRMRFSNFH